jgi:hypothetical protein
MTPVEKPEPTFLVLPDNDAPRRPKFRIVAAGAMIASIIAGVGIAVFALLALGKWVRLDSIPVISEWLSVESKQSSSVILSVGGLFKTWLTDYPSATLMIISMCLFVGAFLLRKVVLSGLRD